MKKLKRKFKRWHTLNIDWNALVLFTSLVVCLICLVIWLVAELKDDTDKLPPITEITEYSAFSPSTEGHYIDTMATYDEAPEQKYIGECKLTVYTPYCDNGKWGYQTATGADSQHLMTCAVDPDIIPYGSNVIIRKGENEIRLKAIDCGSGVKGKHVDIFYDGSESAGIEWLMYEFGESAEVWTEEV